MKKYAISIDGPSGCGKSTVAKIIAEKYDLAFISSGIFYRIVAFFINKNDTNNIIKEKLEKIDIQYKDNVFYVNNENFLEKVFNNEISLKASVLAQNFLIRNFVKEKLQKLASKNNVIIDGRDIGSKVLPNADLKIFLTASVMTRFLRRKKELKISNQKVNSWKLFWQIFKRDWNDVHRKIDPLVKPIGSIKISSNNKSINQVIKEIENLIKK